MNPQAGTLTSAETETRRSWVPMIAIALGQSLMSFNVASLPVALSGMVNSFNVPPTTVATGIVMYSLAVAGFVMLGAKLNQRFGAVIIFRAVVALFMGAQVLMTLSPTANLMLTAQLLAGLAGAALVPSLVALIANEYHGEQQAAALGALGSARAGAGVLAFLIGGVLLQAFIVWTRRRTAAGKTPLLALPHADHFGGIRGVVSDADLKAGEIQILAPKGFMHEAISENLRPI